MYVDVCHVCTYIYKVALGARRWNWNDRRLLAALWVMETKRGSPCSECPFSPRKKKILMHHKYPNGMEQTHDKTMSELISVSFMGEKNGSK